MKLTVAFGARSLSAKRQAGGVANVPEPFRKDSGVTGLSR